jgi:hypothetical protein
LIYIVAQVKGREHHGGAIANVPATKALLAVTTLIDLDSLITDAAG